MYIAGRNRTASMPSKTVILVASYLGPCLAVDTVILTPFSDYSMHRNVPNLQGPQATKQEKNGLEKVLAVGPLYSTIDILASAIYLPHFLGQTPEGISFGESAY